MVPRRTCLLACRHMAGRGHACQIKVGFPSNSGELIIQLGVCCRSKRRQAGGAATTFFFQRNSNPESKIASALATPR